MAEKIPVPCPDEDFVTDLRNCPKCKNALKSPRLLLNCFHVVCETCLKHAIKGKKPGEVFQCMVCEKYVSVPWEGVAEFPVPLFLQYVNGPGGVSPSADHVPCSKHYEEKVTMYCKQCDTAICHVCVVTEDCHQNHPCVSIRASFADLDSKKGQLGTQVQKLRTKMGMKNDAIAQIDRQKRELSSQEAEAEKEIDTHFQGLMDILTREKEAMKRQLHTKVKIEHRLLSKRRSSLVNSRNGLAVVTCLATHLMEDASPREVMLHQRSLSSVMAVHETEEDHMAHKTEKVEFVPHGTTRSASRSGKISGGATGLKRVSGLKLVRSFIAKADVDRSTPDIEILAVNNDMSIVAPDCDNNNLKIFDRSSKLISVWSGDDAYQLGKPIGVCCTEDGTVVFCDWGKDQIVFLDSRHRVVRTIKANNCLSVVVTGDHIVYTASVPSVVVLSKHDGRVVREIKHDRQGRNIFGWPNGIAMTKQGHLVVTDIGNHCVFVLSMGGEVLHRYGREGSVSQGDDCLSYPSDVCVDQFGHILVTDFNNHRIHMLSPDAEFICHLVTDRDGLHRPQGIALDQEGHLIVSEFETGKIKVFDYLI